jgi:hypothetical protein
MACEVTIDGFRAPHLVATVAAALAREVLSRGIEVDEIFFALPPSSDRCETLLAALTSGDFATLPKLKVRAVRPRYAIRYYCEGLECRETDGVALYTDDEVWRGDHVLMLLKPPRDDARSALRRILADEPQVTRASALDRVRAAFPKLSKRAFDRDWPVARQAAGLSEQAPRGRRKKICPDIPR